MCITNSSVFSINIDYNIVPVKHEGLQKSEWIMHIPCPLLKGLWFPSESMYWPIHVYYALPVIHRNINLLKYAQINEEHSVSQDSQFFTITSGFYEWKTMLLYSPSIIIIIMSTSEQEDMLEDGYSLLEFFKHEILLQVNILKIIYLFI